MIFDICYVWNSSTDKSSDIRTILNHLTESRYAIERSIYNLECLVIGTRFLLTAIVLKCFMLKL